MMKLVIGLLFIIIGPISAQSVVDLETLLQNEWTLFKINFNKTYGSPREESLRREIFIENRQRIIDFNVDYGLGRNKFVLQVNGYGDRLHHEFNAINGFRGTRVPDAASARNGGGSRIDEAKPATFIPPANVVFPAHVDWRDSGAVSAVKDQRDCLGCWAFSAAGALEGHHFRKTGQLYELSAQNLIDCTTGEYENRGCTGGGTVTSAFQYVDDNSGLDVEQAYPFENRDGLCRYRREANGVIGAGFVQLDEGDEKQLEAAVATLGPVSVSLDFSSKELQFYSKGVFYDPKCSSDPNNANHAVLVVGYGTETDGRRYWLVKNSYGPHWGEGGYIKIAKDAGNQCGIANFATYPLVA